MKYEKHGVEFIKSKANVDWILVQRCTISFGHFIKPVLADGWRGTIDRFFSFIALTKVRYEGPYSSTPATHPLGGRVIGMGATGNIDYGCPSPSGFYDGCLEWQRPALSH